MHKILSKLWKMFGGAVQWRLLWLFHSKFIIGTAVVVLDGSGHVLLLRHRFWRKDSWGLPSGYVISGEAFEDCAAREVREETGLTIRVDRMLRIKSGFRLRVEVTYLAHLVGGDMKLDSGEILEARFFPLDRLPQGLLESHRTICESLVSNTGPSPTPGTPEQPKQEL